MCLGLEVALFAYYWQVQFRWSVVEPLRYFQGKGHVLEISIYAVLLFLLSSMYGGIRLGYLKNVELIFSQVFATLMANILIYAELSVMAFCAGCVHYHDGAADGCGDRIYQCGQPDLPHYFSAPKAFADPWGQTHREYPQQIRAA